MTPAWRTAAAVLTAGVVLCQGVQDAAAAQTDPTAASVAVASRWRGFAQNPGLVLSDTVVVASGGGWADGLSAGALAGTIGAPLLLTAADGTLPSATAAQIRRLKASTIIVVGGEASVSTSVERQLRPLTVTTGRTPGRVRRLAGPDRYATAAAVAAEFPAGTRSVYLASGLAPADALTASAVAGRASSPVLLTPPTGVNPATSAALRQIAPQQVVLAGGDAVIPEQVAATVRSTVPTASVRRAGGRTRYHTAAALSATVNPSGSATSVFLVDGADYQMAMPLAAASAAFETPMLLTNGSTVPDATSLEMARLGARDAITDPTLPAFVRPRPAPDTALRAGYAQQATRYLEMAEESAATRATSTFAESQMAYVHAQRKGWDDPDARRHWKNVMDHRHPNGGWGLLVPVVYPSGTNPETTDYTVTISDHVGPTLFSAYDAGVASREDVQRALDVLLAMQRRTYPDGSQCMAYDNASYHETLSDADGFCVANVNDSAAWFIVEADKRGITAPGARALAGAIHRRTTAMTTTGFLLPYSGGVAAVGIMQDLDHYSLDAEAHMVYGSAAVKRGGMLARTMSTPLTWNGTDVLGKLRMLRYDPSKCSTMVDYAERMATYALTEWAPANRLDIRTVRYAQLAERLQRAATSC